MPSMTGAIIYYGPSQIDRAHIATILTFESHNPKTGGMAQTTTIRTDIEPNKSRRCGNDVSMCGSCPQRPALGGGCYVTPMALISIWKRLNNEKMLQRGMLPYLPVPPSASPEMFAGWFIRVGTYGDPCAVPIHVWRALLTNVAGWTGYTHLWRQFPDYKEFCMASVDSPAEADEAQALGWRTFRTKPEHSKAAVLAGEIVCPASAEGGHKLQCWNCLLCGGTGGRRQGKNIVIKAHGTKARKHRSLGGLAGGWQP